MVSLTASVALLRLSYMVHPLRCSNDLGLPLNSFHLGRIHCLGSDFKSTRIIEFIVFELSSPSLSTEQMKRLRSASSGCEWMRNRTLRRLDELAPPIPEYSLTRLPLLTTPQLLPFLNDETSRVKLMLHISYDFVHG